MAKLVIFAKLNCTYLLHKIYLLRVDVDVDDRLTSKIMQPGITGRLKGSDLTIIWWQNMVRRRRMKV